MLGGDIRIPTASGAGARPERAAARPHAGLQLQHHGRLPARDN